MRKPFRFVLYIMVGFLIYQVIDSGETSFSHSEVRNSLLIGIAVIFVLLIVVRIIKQRYDDKD